MWNVIRVIEKLMAIVKVVCVYMCVHVCLYNRFLGFLRNSVILQ